MSVLVSPNFLLNTLIGVYKTEQFSSTQNEWIENKDVKMEITVEVHIITLLIFLKKGTH